MLNRLEKRQLKYCFFVGWCKLSLFVFSWICIQLNQHRPQGTSYRSEATLAFSSDNLLSECHLSFPLSCLLHLPTPTLEMFLNNIWFSVFFFFWSSTLFLSSFEQFYIWLCANQFSWLYPLSYLWCVTRSTLFLFYWKSRESKHILVVLDMEIIFLNFRQFQYVCLHLRYLSLTHFMVYEKI